MAEDLGESFAFGGGIADDFEVALAAGFATVLLDNFAGGAAAFTVATFPVGLTAAFLTTLFAVTALGTDLAGADFAFFAGSGKDFAGFFIAFAMESTTNQVVLSRKTDLRF